MELTDMQKKLFEMKTPSGKDPDRVLLSGGICSGKSVGVYLYIIKVLEKFPGIKILINTPYDYYFDEFIIDIWKKCFDMHRTDYKYFSSKRSWVFDNGSVMDWKSIQSRDNAAVLAYNLIVLEEGQAIGNNKKEKAKEMVVSLLQHLRSYDVDGRRLEGLFIALQNPCVENWAYDFFIDGATKVENEYEKITPDGKVWYTITSSSTDNPHLPIEMRKIVEEL